MPGTARTRCFGMSDATPLCSGGAAVLEKGRTDDFISSVAQNFIAPLSLRLLITGTPCSLSQILMIYSINIKIGI